MGYIQDTPKSDREIRRFQRKVEGVFPDVRGDFVASFTGGRVLTESPNPVQELPGLIDDFVGRYPDAITNEGALKDILRFTADLLGTDRTLDKRDVKGSTGFNSFHFNGVNYPELFVLVPSNIMAAKINLRGRVKIFSRRLTVESISELEKADEIGKNHGVYCWVDDMKRHKPSNGQKIKCWITRKPQPIEYGSIWCKYGNLRTEDMLDHPIDTPDRIKEKIPQDCDKIQRAYKEYEKWKTTQPDHNYLTDLPQDAQKGRIIILGWKDAVQTFNGLYWKYRPA